MIEIRTFKAEDRDEVIALVLHCQNDGSRTLVTVDNQPELLSIREKFILPGGSFWVARHGGAFAGCIGLLNCGNGVGVLKKFFVYEPYRGNPHHLGQKLYAELMTFAKAGGFTQILLDTPKNTERAHRFYDKAGFVKVDKADLPVKYDCPYEDCDFFLLKL